jgi:ribosomal protein S18 acetylase RimI-like enzyme
MAVRLAPLDDSRYARFWELFEESMPPDADGVYGSLGVTREEAERLPREVGELRQVEAGGEVAGYAWIEVRERVLHVHALLLEPGFRGRGLGAEVLGGLEDELGGRIDEVELGVLPGNERARALYERTGFEQVDERLGFLIMRKSLVS